MKKSSKILVGIATLWPFLYMVFFFLVVFSSVFFMNSSRGPESGPPLLFLVIFPLHLLTMLGIIGLSIFYIVNVFRNDRVDKDKKVLWAVVLFLGNMIAMPIYWYLYIWKEPGIVPTPLPLNSGDTSAWVNNANTSAKQTHYAPPPEMPNWRQD
jgi:hypothetical protein